MQTNDKDFLKKVSVNSMKQYLKKYAKQQVSVKTKASVMKKLQQWRKQIKGEKKKQHSVC